jgi:hypothetical protein
MTTEKAVSQGRLAEKLNEGIDSLHDPAVSSDPFEWSDDAERLDRNERVVRDTKTALAGYRHRSKSGAVGLIIGLGVGIPAAAAGGLFLYGPSFDQGLPYYVGLGAAALVAFIVAAVVGHNPDLDEDFALAAYTAARRWSFSRANCREAWRALAVRYTYFNKGNEDQAIKLRVWGFMDEAKKIPFMMFRFYYETVHYVTEKVGKTTVRRKVETPHWRYGIFIKLPESKARFRLSEGGGDAGLDRNIKFEYGAFNDAVDVWCDPHDELEVRKFLSPAVLEIAHGLSKDLPDLTVDFFSGHAMLVSQSDFLGSFGDVALDERAGSFEELLKTGADTAERFRQYVGSQFEKMRKYND